MIKSSRNSVLILDVTGFLLGIFIFLMLKIYNITLSDTNYSHQIEQLSIANSTTRNIESYLSELLSSKTKELTRLNNINSIHNFLKTDSSNFYSALGFQQNDKVLINIRSNKNINSGILTDFQQKNYSDTSTILLSEIEFYNDTTAVFIAAIPVTYNQQNNSSRAIIFYMFNVNALMYRFITALKLSTNDFILVLDIVEALNFSPNSHDIISRSILEIGNDCSEFHTSFAT